MVSVEHENLWNDLDIYKVVRVLSSGAQADDENVDDSHGGDNPPDDSTGDQVLIQIISISVNTLQIIIEIGVSQIFMNTLNFHGQQVSLLLTSSQDGSNSIFQAVKQ